MNGVFERRLQMARGPRPGLLAVSVVVAALSLLAGAHAASAQVKGTYLYTLSNFGGRVPYDWARVYVDQERDETYVIYQSLVRIFNASGMETFSFGDDLALGQIVDLVVDGDGNIILLSYDNGRAQLIRCNFRGVPIGPFEVTGLPDGLAFGGNRMLYRNGRFYFISTGGARVIVTDAAGVFQRQIDLLAALGVDEARRGDVELGGMTVDGDGNVFFTVPVQFKVCKLTPAGVLTSFGRPGSAPGRFGVVAGLAIDSRGNILVADKLKCVVLAFDKDFNFLSEFGYRGLKPGNLIVPDDIAIDKRDRVFVTQARRRGVSVFTLSGA